MVTLQHRPLDGLDLIRIEGRLGAADSADAAAQMVSILDRGTGLVHLDLGALEFLDSSGLAVLVSLLKRARRAEGDVILYNANERVQALLELTRLHEIFETRVSEAYRAGVYARAA